MVQVRDEVKSCPKVPFLKPEFICIAKRASETIIPIQHKNIPVKLVRSLHLSLFSLTKTKIQGQRISVLQDIGDILPFPPFLHKFTDLLLLLPSKNKKKTKWF